MTTKQQLLNEQQTEQIARYRSDLAQWRQDRRDNASATVVLAITSAPLWVTSYFAAGAIGAVNQPVWFVCFSIVAFVGAAVCSIAAFVTFMTATQTSKPRPPTILADADRFITQYGGDD